MQADYGSVEALTAILRAGQYDAVVSLINQQQLEAEMAIIQAAVAAGVQRILPSAFAMGTERPEARALPTLQVKVTAEDYLRAQAGEGATTYTSINTSVFLDWALDIGVLVNLRGGATPLFNGGHVQLSATLLDDIGKAVVGVLLHPEETKNRTVYVRSAVLTQNQLLAYAKAAAPDKEFPTIPLDANAVEKQAWERYHGGDRSRDTLRAFVVGYGFGKGLAHFQPVDNELLGISVLSDEQLRDEVTKRVLAG